MDNKLKEVLAMCEELNYNLLAYFEEEVSMSGLNENILKNARAQALENYRERTGFPDMNYWMFDDTYPVEMYKEIPLSDPSEPTWTKIDEYLYDYLLFLDGRQNNEEKVRFDMQGKNYKFNLDELVDNIAKEIVKYDNEEKTTNDCE